MLMKNMNFLKHPHLGANLNLFPPVTDSSPLKIETLVSDLNRQLLSSILAITIDILLNYCQRLMQAWAAAK